MSATLTRPQPIPLIGSTATDVEGFRVGTHTDSAGNTKDWALPEIEEAAAAYNESLGIHEAPVLHGHSGSYAYGWISGASVADGTLLLNYKDVESEFARRVNERRHPKRSISFYEPDSPNNPTPGRWNIRHIAYLPAPGEDNPAVKGLSDHKFAAPPPEHLYEFADEWIGRKSYGLQIVHQILQGMRDRAIEANGLDAANEQFPPDMLSELQNVADRKYLTPDEYDMLESRIRFVEGRIDNLFDALERRLAGYEASQRELETMYSQQGNPSMTVNANASAAGDSQTSKTSEAPAASDTQPAATPSADFSQQFAEFSQAITSLTDVVKDVQSTLATQGAEIAAQRQRQKESDIRSFAQAMVGEARMRPTEMENEIERLSKLDDENAVLQFGEADDECITPLAFAKQEIRNRPPMWNNSRLPTNRSDAPEYSDEGDRLEEGFDAESVRQHRKVEAYQKEHDCSYAEAMEACKVAV